MDNLEIRGLEFQIKENSDSAVASLGRLEKALSALKTATSGGASGVRTAANQIAALNKALSGSGAVGQKLKSIAAGLKAISDVGTVKIPKSLGTNMQALGTAISGISDGDIDKLYNVADALRPLSELEGAHMRSYINQLSAFPDVVRELRAADIDEFSNQMTRLANALRPFATEMQHIADGFSAMPSRIQRLITTTEKYNNTVNKGSTQTSRFGISLKNIKTAAFMAGIRMIRQEISKAITESNAYQEDLNLFTASMGQYAKEAQGILKMAVDIAAAAALWVAANKSINLLQKKILPNLKKVVTLFKDGGKELSGWEKASNVLHGTILIALGAKWSWDAGYEIGKGTAAVTDYIKAILGPVAMGVGGALIGASFAGIGAAAGFAIGLTLGLVIECVAYFKGRQEKILDDFYQTDFGKQVASLKADIEEHQQLGLDLIARIDSITGAIPDDVMVNLQQAQQLVNDIFEIDSSKNKTAAEIAIIQEKIKVLNGLGLPGLQLSFDETTQHIVQTKDEVQAVIDKLLEQYKVEAMKDAIVEAYKAQNEAMVNVYEAQVKVRNAAEDYAVVAKELNELQAEQRELTDKLSKSVGTGGVSGDYIELNDRLTEVNKKVYEQQTKLKELGVVVDESAHDLDTYNSAYDRATEKVNILEGALSDMVGSMTNMVKPATEDGKNVTLGFGKGIVSGAEYAKSAMDEACKKILNEERKYNGIHSPSTLYTGEGKYMMLGFRNGISKNQGVVTNAMESMLNALLDRMETFSNRCRDVLNSMLSDYRSAMSSVSVSSSGNVSYRPVSRIRIPRFASGGVVDEGQLFIARESGPEMVGRMGNRTAVVNNDQIVDGISAGVYRAVREAMGNGSKGQPMTVVVQMNGKEMFRQVVRENNAVVRATGASPLVT